jgi:hypothetical protein
LDVAHLITLKCSKVWRWCIPENDLIINLLKIG